MVEREKTRIAEYLLFRSTEEKRPKLQEEKLGAFVRKEMGYEKARARKRQWAKTIMGKCLASS